MILPAGMNIKEFCNYTDKRREIWFDNTQMVGAHLQYKIDAIM